MICRSLVIMLFLSACLNKESSPKIIYSTELHEACSRGSYLKVQELLAEKSNINAKDGFGKSPLEWAVQEGHYHVAKLLLDYGADVDIKGGCCGATPLCTAVQKNDYDIAKLLLEHGANTEADDGYDRTPLGNAIINKNYKMAKLLLEHGANPNKYVTTETVYSRSILAEAIFQENVDMIALLKKHGADINCRDKYGQTDAHHLENISPQNFEKLLKNGLDPSIKDKLGKNSFFCLPQGRPNRYEDISKFIKLLKAHGMNINDFSEVDEDYINPLLQAVIVGDFYLADILLLNGANIEEGAWEMRSVTPLQIAAMSGNLEMVKILLKHGAAIEGTHYWGITSLSSAADLGKDFPQKYDIYRKERSWGVIHQTSPEEYAKIAKVLIENGANVNNVEKYGETPLHHAVRGGSEVIVRLLLKHGAKTDAANYDKETPLDIAKKLKLGNIQKILENTDTLMSPAEQDVK